MEGASESRISCPSVAQAKLLSGCNRPRDAFKWPGNGDSAHAANVRSPRPSDVVIGHASCERITFHSRAAERTASVWAAFAAAQRLHRVRPRVIRPTSLDSASGTCRHRNRSKRACWAAQAVTGQALFDRFSVRERRCGYGRRGAGGEGANAGGRDAAAGRMCAGRGVAGKKGLCRRGSGIKWNVRCRGHESQGKVARDRQQHRPPLRSSKRRHRGAR